MKPNGPRWNDTVAILSFVGTAVARYRRRAAIRRVRHDLLGLPPHLQGDLGWPLADIHEQK